MTNKPQVKIVPYHLYSDIDLPNICFNLAQYGFTLTGEYSGNLMSVEDLIVRILHGCEEPRCIEGLFVILAKHSKKIYYNRICTRAKKEEIVNPLGWLFEEGASVYKLKGIEYHIEMDSAINWLWKRKRRDETELVPSLRNQKWAIKIAKINRTAIAEKWGILFGLDYRSIYKRLDTYNCYNVRQKYYKREAYLNIARA